MELASGDSNLVWGNAQTSKVRNHCNAAIPAIALNDSSCWFSDIRDCAKMMLWWIIEVSPL
jgi:hypothetical protein